MRIINIEEIISNIKEMCIEANIKLASDVEIGIRRLITRSPLSWKAGAWSASRKS